MNTNSTLPTRSTRSTLRRGLVAGAVAVAGVAMVASTAPVVAGNLITAKDLAKGSVTSKAIAKKTVKSKNLADGAVKTAKIKDGNVTGTKLADGSVSSSKLTDGSVTSAKLAAGSVGRAQLAADAQPLWAFVWGGPTINRGKGAVSVAVEGVVGQYRVTFDRDVSQCGYTATMASPKATDPEQIGFIDVSSFGPDPKAVIVRTRDSAGPLAARGFTIQVWC